MSLSCDFHLSGSVYRCTVLRASFGQPGISLNLTNDRHKPGKSNSDVEAITFRNTNVSYLPRNIAKLFPNVKQLSVYNCGLLMLTREDLMGLENLEGLSICGNRLQSLPSDLFVGMKKLRKIAFYSNRLEYMSSKILQPILGTLQSANFQMNTKIGAIFDPENANSVESLQKLMEIIDRSCLPPQGHSDATQLRQLTTSIMNTASIWQAGDISDFTIIAGPQGAAKKFKVHKIILGTQSDVFDAAFNRAMEENKFGVMHIDDLSAIVVEGFLHFMYTGVVKDESIAMDLFVIAARFNVKLLMDKAEEILLRTVDRSNAYEIFQFANNHNLNRMKLAAFEAIRSMFPQKKIDDSFIDDPETLKIVVDSYLKMVKISEEIDNLLEQKKKK
jgi:hypothetical protein